MATSELLTCCLIEGDAEEVARQRRAKRRALVVSVALQAILVGASLLITLLATGKLPNRPLVTPSPPYRGSGESKPTVVRTDPRAGKPVRQSMDNFLLAPPHIPAHISIDASPSEVPSLADGQPGSGSPDGILPSKWFAAGTALRFKPPLAPAPVKPNPSVLRRSEGVQQALLIHQVLPAYPALARQGRLEGTVVLHALISRDGNVGSLEAVNGQPVLAQAALEAVRQWRYRPTLLNGEPVEVETTITVIFRLHD